MSDTLTQTLVFDVQMGAIRGSSQARNAIEALASQAMGAGTIKGIRSSTRQLETDMKRVMASAFKSGMRTEGRALYQVFRDSSQAIVKAREQVARIDNQLLMSTDRAHRQRLMRDRENLRREIQTREAATKNQIDLLDAQASRAADMLEQASRNASRNWQQSVEKSGKAFSDLVDGALNIDSLDPSQMIKGFGQKFQEQLAPRLTQFGAKNAGKGGMLGGLGKAAKVLGGAGVAIAGAAAAIGGLVAIFMAAYGQTKKLNQALLEGQSAADMFNVMENRGRGLSARLTELREAALGTAYMFRMSGEEVAQMIGQINEAGLQINEWKDYTGAAANSMGEFALVTHQAFVASKVFGQSVSEISGFTATMFHEMGKGLERVDEGFRMIFAGAQRSSMSTKQFFTSVTEASSGMALYNFRLDDTVGLLLQMTEVLGEDLATSQSRMAGQYRNMGMEQRIQTVMNAGGSRVSARIMKADFAAQADEFAANFGDAIKNDAGLAGALGGVFSGGALNREALGNMGEEDFRSLIYEIRHTQGNAAMAMQLENIVGLARGSRGGLTNTATNLGSLSRQGELMQQLMEGRTLLGSKGISSFEGLNRQAYENITGRSGEDFEILQRIDRDLRGQYDAYVKSLAPGTQAQSFEEFGINALGADPALQNEAFKSMPAMERIAREHMKETRSIAQTLKNVIARSLEGIYNFVSGIWGKMMGGSARTTAMQEAEEAIDAEYEKIEAAQEEMAEASEILNNPDSSVYDIAAAKNTQQQAQYKIETAKERIADYNRQYKEMAMGGGDAFVAASAEENFRTNPDNHYGSTAPDMAPTAEAAEVAAAAPEARKEFMDRVNELNARMIADGLVGLNPVVHLGDEDKLATYLETRRTTDKNFPQGMKRIGTSDDTQWRYYPTGGTTPYGEKITIGAMPSGDYGENYMYADDHDVIGRGHPGGSGYFLRSSGIADFDEDEQNAILDYIAGGDRNNPTGAGNAMTNWGHTGTQDYTGRMSWDSDPAEWGVTAIPGIYDLPPVGGTGPMAVPFYSPGNEGISQEDRDAILEFLNSDPAFGTVDALDDTNLTLDDLLSENSDTADAAWDSLGVQEDQRTELKNILTQLQSDSTPSASTMKELSGMTDRNFLANMKTAEGRAAIAAAIKRRGRGTEDQRLNAREALQRPLNDFIWRPGSAPRFFSNNDTVIGVKGRGERSLGGGVHIEIHGGDPEIVYQTVKRAMKSSGMA